MQEDEEQEIHMWAEDLYRVEATGVAVAIALSSVRRVSE